MGWNTYTQGPSANSQWVAPIDSFFDTFFSSPIHLFFLLHSVSFFQSDLMLVPRWAAHHLLRTITREPTKTKIFYICLTRNNLNNLSTMVLGIKRKSTKITNRGKKYFQQNSFRHFLTFFLSITNIPVPTVENDIISSDGPPEGPHPLNRHHMLWGNRLGI